MQIAPRHDTVNTKEKKRNILRYQRKRKCTRASSQEMRRGASIPLLLSSVAVISVALSRKYSHGTFGEFIGVEIHLLDFEPWNCLDVENYLVHKGLRNGGGVVFSYLHYKPLCVGWRRGVVTRFWIMNTVGMRRGVGHTSSHQYHEKFERGTRDTPCHVLYRMKQVSCGGGLLYTLSHLRFVGYLR